MRLGTCRTDWKWTQCLEAISSKGKVGLVVDVDVAVKDGEIVSGLGAEAVGKLC